MTRKMLLLPCGKGALVPKYWEEFDFPFFGCLDHCPKGFFREKETCKEFQEKYDLYADLYDKSKGRIEVGCKWVKTIES